MRTLISGAVKSFGCTARSASTFAENSGYSSGGTGRGRELKAQGGYVHKTDDSAPPAGDKPLSCKSMSRLALSRMAIMPRMRAAGVFPNYYLQNPDMVLGKMAFWENMYGNATETACVPLEGADLKAVLLLEIIIQCIELRLLLPDFRILRTAKL